MLSWDKYQENVFKNPKWDNDPEEVARLKIAQAFTGKGNKILDIGCGNAVITEAMRKQGNEVWAVDYPKVIKQVRKKYPRIRCSTSPVTDLSYMDNVFDIVTSFEVVEHVIDLEKFFSEAKRVLKPNGKLILTTPNLARTYNIVALLGGYSYGIYYPLSINMHINFFTPKTLIQVVEHYGFETEFIGTVPTKEGNYPEIMDKENFDFLKKIMYKHLQEGLRGDVLYLVAKKKEEKE